MFKFVAFFNGLLYNENLTQVITMAKQDTEKHPKEPMRSQGISISLKYKELKDLDR